MLHIVSKKKCLRLADKFCQGSIAIISFAMTLLTNCLFASSFISRLGKALEIYCLDAPSFIYVIFHF